MKKSFILVYITIGFASILFGCERAERPAVAKPLYTINKTDQAPVIDGILNDEGWDGLPSMEMALCGGGGNPRFPTSVRMTYDDTHIYVGFECSDLDAASTITEFDGPIADEEHVTLCIDAGSGAAGYFMISVAPTGAVADAFVLNSDNGDRIRILPGWNCERLRVSVVVYGDGPRPGDQDRFWTVEMAIPFAEILTAPQIPPVPGDTWRINAYRLELTGGRELSACFPTGDENIHRPRRFAVVSFGE